MMKKILLSLFLLSLLIGFDHAHAQEFPPEVINQEARQSNYKGAVVEVFDHLEGGQTVLVEITTGDKSGTKVEIKTGLAISENAVSYNKGDKVLLLAVTDSISPENSTFYITDFDRTGPLFLLFVIFVIVVISISKRWGFYSLVGMAYSFFIIFKFILPLLLRGNNPLFIAIVGSLFIAPVTFYLSHGFNRKTTIALMSTIVTLLITGLLSIFFINISNLTGFESDEAFFLHLAKGGIVNIKGIFIAGVVIGTLGILDDVTISQSAIVYQLKSSIRGIEKWELYKKAMEVGHDHIASTVNTLVLVYTGAALPLLLLFTDSSRNFVDAINAEMIAAEVVRTLVGSIGLVLAVPISTFFAVYLFANIKYDKSSNSIHQHSH